ncbi:MAG: MlaD family protein [Sulfurimonas sp.]
MSYNRIRLIVGIFVIVLFVTIVSFSYLLLKEKGAFERSYKYHFITESAAAFSVGMPLRFSGFKIGVIDEIELKDDGKVFMTFSVSKKNSKWITQESVLLVRKPLIGSPHIEIYSPIGVPPLKEGGELDIYLSDDINDMISKLEPAVDRLINIIDSVDKITTYIAKEDSPLKNTLKNLETFSGNLAKNDALLTSVTGDAKATQDLVDSLSSLSKVMKDMNSVSKRIETDVLEPTSLTLKELHLITKDIRKKLQKLDGVVTSVGSFDSEIVLFKEQLSVTLQKTNLLIDKIDSLMTEKESKRVELP